MPSSRSHGPAGPTRPTLLDEARRALEDHHRRKLAELTQLAPLLRAFDPYRAELAARGLTVSPEQLRRTVDYVNVAPLGARCIVALSIATDSVFDDRRAHQWLQALLGLGFALMRRGDWYLLLRRGRLYVSVDRPRDGGERARTAADHAVRLAEAAGARAVHALRADACSAAARLPEGAA